MLQNLGMSTFLACTDFDAGTNWGIPLQGFAKGDLSYTEHTQTTQKYQVCIFISCVAPSSI